MLRERRASRVPPIYQEAYRGWVEGGWQGLPAPAEHGGQGLPQRSGLAVLELVSAADMAFGLCPLLTAGAIEALERYATPEQAERWLPRLVSGEWTGAMCLTEPQAGSRPRRGPHPRRAGGRRRLPRCTARRSSSPGASTT